MPHDRWNNYSVCLVSITPWKQEKWIMNPWKIQAIIYSVQVFLWQETKVYHNSYLYQFPPISLVLDFFTLNLHWIRIFVCYSARDFHLFIVWAHCGLTSVRLGFLWYTSYRHKASEDTLDNLLSAWLTFSFPWTSESVTS